VNPKKWKPIFIENSKIPVWLSKIVPIEIEAVAFFLFVWTRGEPDSRLKQHEIIHFQQQLELLFVGQWILYGLYYLKGLVQYRDKHMAYTENPFEREAHRNESVENYLENRKRYSWLSHRE